jgi:hypothetical protein
MSSLDVLRNLGLKAARRVRAVPKPFVRMMRRRARTEEHRAFQREAEAIDEEIARIASGSGPIVAGPWLAEVGYEVLYWIPFLRWFQDAYGISPDRLIVVSRGGMEALYRDLAGAYEDIFDLTTTAELAVRNAQRRSEREGGGQKQSAISDLDAELLAAVRTRRGMTTGSVLHPSLMFRLFRNVWHGNLPYDLLWRRTRYVATAHQRLTTSATLAGMPDDFIAVKVYGGPAMSMSRATRAATRALVAQAASIAPVVLLETELGIDEHRDFDLSGLPGVISASGLMTARTNLDVQLALIARARVFLSSCGGLAWLAPFLGVPTVAIYDSDHLLAPHLFVARQAGARVGAAEFTPLDLRALDRLALIRPDASPIDVAGRQA